MEEVKHNSIANNLLFSFLNTVIIGLVNYVYPIIIGLLYGPEIIGSFTIMLYWSLLLGILITQGISPAISRFIAANGNIEPQRIVNVGEKTSTFYLVAVVIIFSICAALVMNISFLSILFIVIMLIVMSFHYLYKNSLQGQEKFTRLLKIELISFCIFILAFVPFCILPAILNWTALANENYLLIPLIIYHLIFDIFIIFPEIRRYNIRSIFKLPKETKGILSYAIIIGFGSLFGIGISQIQIIISESFLNDFEVGVLSFLSSINAIIILVSVSLNGLLVPRITNLRNSQTKLDYKFLKLVNFSVILILGPIFGLIFILIGMYPSILDTLTLNKYQMTSNWFVLVLLAAQVICNLFATPTISYFSASEKNVKLNPIIATIYSIAVVLSWIFLVPIYGLIGFAFGMAIGGFCLNLTTQILLLILTKGKIGYNIFLFLGGYGILGLCIYLVTISKEIIPIIIWPIISIVMFVFGVKMLVKIFKNRDFSIKYQKLDNQANVVDQ